MPKIRGVKPDLWTDEDFVELSPYARLLWIGLWNFACDNGHIQDKSKQIKMRVLPTDDVNCAELLREIEARGLITRADGWITVPNLSHHQKPHKRWWTTCDKPGCELPEGASHAPYNRSATVAPPKRNRGATADGDVDVDGDGDVDGDLKDPSSEVADATPRPDVAKILDHLDDRIRSNGAKTPSRSKKNTDAARLLLDRDNHTVDEVIRAIDFATSDEFWRTNVLSMSKLRDKYDQLRLAATRRGASSGRPEPTRTETQPWMFR